MLKVLKQCLEHKSNVYFLFFKNSLVNPFRTMPCHIILKSLAQETAYFKSSFNRLAIWLNTIGCVLTLTLKW